MEATRSPDVTRTLLQVIAILVMIAACGWILSPFLLAGAWATTIVVATWSLLLRVQAVCGGRRGPAVAVMSLGLLLVRSLLSQMDVPARGAYVMSVVTPAERPAAASFTAVPRSLASALSPSLTGAMFAAGAMATPLVLCGVLKSVYDVALLALFRKVRPRD